MGFLSIPQLSTAAFSPARSLSDGTGSASAGADMDPTGFAQACTRAADSLATSGLGAQSSSGSGTSGSDTRVSASSAGLLGLLGSLFGGEVSAGVAAGAGGVAALPGIAQTVAGVLA